MDKNTDSKPFFMALMLAFLLYINKDRLNLQAPDWLKNFHVPSSQVSVIVDSYKVAEPAADLKSADLQSLAR